MNETEKQEVLAELDALRTRAEADLARARGTISAYEEAIGLVNAVPDDEPTPPPDDSIPRSEVERVRGELQGLQNVEDRNQGANLGRLHAFESATSRLTALLGDSTDG